jgi:hypothetical protein
VMQEPLDQLALFVFERARVWKREHGMATTSSSATAGVWRVRCRSALRVCRSGRDTRKPFAALRLGELVVIESEPIKANQK